MSTLLLSVIIGIVAGSVVVIFSIPMMLMKKYRKRDAIPVFLKYFFVSIIVVNFDLPHIVWWLQGGLISVALYLPNAIIVILFGSGHKKTTLRALVMSFVWGTLIGIAGHFLK